MRRIFRWFWIKSQVSRTSVRQQGMVRPTVEQLEDRMLLSHLPPPHGDDGPPIIIVPPGDHIFTTTDHLSSSSSSSGGSSGNGTPGRLGRRNDGADGDDGMLCQYYGDYSDIIIHSWPIQQI
jgi:hypothetical protein